LKTGSIADTDVTAQDIVRAGIIYGRHPALLAGKTVERPTPNLREEPEPIERQTQVLYVDVAFEDGIPGVIGVAKPIDALMYADLPVHYDSACTSTAIDQLCGLLEQRGLSVVKVVVDGDTRFDPSKIRALTERVAAGSRVSVAERAIRVVKERTRAIRSNLPFEVPKAAARELVKYAVCMLNLFPADSETDPRSPRERATGIRPSLKHIRGLAFGDYAQIPLINGGITKRSTTHPRTVGAIALRPTFNAQGAWYFIRIDTGETVKFPKHQYLPRYLRLPWDADQQAAPQNRSVHVRIHRGLP
jgi:hypothetical protein